jgi:hypothetical protein
MSQQRLAGWALVVMVLMAATVMMGCGTTTRRQTSPGEPESAAEVAQGLRAGSFERKRVTSATCHLTSPGHWICLVRFANGRTGTVGAAWYGRERALGLSLVALTK